MPTPDSNSILHTILFRGNTSIGSHTITPIGSGVNNITVGSGLIEISPTSGSIYAINYITVGGTAFSLSQGSSVFSYTHGGTKLIQDTNFY